MNNQSQPKKNTCEYFRQRLNESKQRLEASNRKRTYKQAFGYENDYECVQEPSLEYLGVVSDNGVRWVDAYTEQFMNLKATSST
uniref:Uncharacterized protein n=1 Tax=viral metagenome TaxID=1070528 RepID=A0A6C0ITG6_9ZZZZ